jgi:hypothetical protein
MQAIPVTYNHVVVGSRQGTDYQVWDWCLVQEIMCTIDPAHWNTGKRGGPAEGPIRNLRMYKTWLESLVAVLIMPYGGKGTNGMRDIAQKGGVVPVYLFDPNEQCWVEI